MTNNISFAIYEGLSDTPRADLGGDLAKAQINSFSTIFPKGLYSDMSLFIPRDTAVPIWWVGGDRIVARNGLLIVWEGEITQTGYAIRASDEGVTISCVGLYGNLLAKRMIDKRWADNRTTSRIWVVDVDDSLGDGKATVDRESERIRITQKEESWQKDEYFAIKYTMPTGETVSRLALKYYFGRSGPMVVDYAKHNDDPAGADTYTDMPNVLDRNYSTAHTLTLTSDDYLYVGVKKLTAFDWIQFDMGATVNAVTATLSGEYYKAADETNPAGWSALTLFSDNTLVSGATLAQNGIVNFVIPNDMQGTTVDSDRAYWIRIQPSANLTASIEINLLERGHTQDWELSVENDSATVIWAETNNSLQNYVSRDDSVGGSSQGVTLLLTALETELPRSDGSYFGQVFDVMVYSESDAFITAGVIAEDLAAHLSSEVSATTSRIGDPALTLEPFYTNGSESIADILDRSLSYGDSSANSWYGRLVSSEKAAAPDGLPVLEVAQYPELDDCDYEVSLTDHNLSPGVSFTRDDYNIRNYVTVSYRNGLGEEFTITPDDESTLKDTTSIATYGERHLLSPLNAGDATYAMALKFGERYLAQSKDAKYYVSSPIKVTGFIQSKAGGRVPASEIEAGKRVRIYGLPPNAAGDSGLTQIITRTQYSEDNNGEYCEIGLEGTPDNLAVMLAQNRAGL